MDTSQRITMLCDADNRLISPILSKLAELITFNRLQIEYDYQQWLTKTQEVMDAMGDEFKKAVETMYQAFIEGFSEIEPMGIVNELYGLDEVLEEPAYNPLLKPLRRIWRERNNNYRKLHALPLIRRSRCRWRQRESRCSLDGLSPHTVILDEYAFTEEG